MGSQKSLVEGCKYYLIASESQAWNNGICILNSIQNNRALVTKIEGANQHTKFNVPISDLYELIQFICIEEFVGKNDGFKLGQIIESSMWHFQNTFIGKHFKPLGIFREERINQILE